jgi:hypothetical protein
VPACLRALEAVARTQLRLEEARARVIAGHEPGRLVEGRQGRAVTQFFVIDQSSPPIRKESIVILAVRDHTSRHSGAWRAAVVVSVLAGALLAVAPAGIAATSKAPICGYAVTFGKSTVGLQSLPPATLKTDYGKFKTLDKKMVPLAPGSVRPDLQSVFNFDLGLFTELSKVGWSFAKIPRSVEQKWAIEGPKLKPASDKVITYLNGTCGLHLTKP